jgi:ribonuclease HII
VNLSPTLNEERILLHRGYTRLAGLDEAGRGAWAGPVSAAAVMLPVTDPLLPERLRGVRDSKLCTPRQRDLLYEQVCQVALSWSVALVPALRIDDIGIVAATREAMQEAVSQLDPPPHALLIDALSLPSIDLPQRSLNKGDVTCLSIAAASIVAKVTRDRWMIAAGQAYPRYGFAKHKGYGTQHHWHALQEMGPLDLHRWYFAPVSATAERMGIDSPRLQRRAK